jgi:hypothetical protein
MTPGDERFTVADDAIDAMLHARADRLAPGGADIVRERLRAELHERRPGGILGFLPIGDRAGAMSGWAGWGVALAAAVLVVVVVGGRPTEDAGTTPMPATPLLSAAPSPSLPAVAGETVKVLDRAGFIRTVADGSLDGQVVLVDGGLRTKAIGCVVGAACRRFSFDGLPDIPVGWTEPKAPLAVHDPARTPVPGTDDWWDGPFLVRPGDGQLEVLGYLAGALENPVTVQVALETRRSLPNDSSPFDILPVQGYLVDGCRGATGPCEGHGPILADSIPGSERIGGQGGVTVLEPAPSPGASAIVEGPFLVRFERLDPQCPRFAQCDLVGWGANPTVIGRYESADIVWVDLAEG